MLTQKDLVVAVCDGGRADHEGDPDPPDWRPVLGLLCAHYRDAIVEWFRHRGVRPHDAEDLAGDFIHRWMSSNPLHRFVPGPCPFRHFLARCLSNFLFEHVERQRAMKRGGDAEHVSDALDEQPAPEHPWTLDDEITLALAIFSQAKRRLDEAQPCDTARRLLLAAALDFRPNCPPPPYEEIAAQTGFTIGNVKVRIFRIREAFREAFHDECTRLGGAQELSKVEMESLFNTLLMALQKGM